MRDILEKWSGNLFNWLMISSFTLTIGWRTGAKWEIWLGQSGVAYQNCRINCVLVSAVGLWTFLPLMFGLWGLRPFICRCLVSGPFYPWCWGCGVCCVFWGLFGFLDHFTPGVVAVGSAAFFGVCCVFWSLFGFWTFLPLCWGCGFCFCCPVLFGAFGL